MLQRPVASPRAFEVWKYTRDRGYYYVFLDRNGMGDYTLVATNDRREPGLPGGIDLVGSEGNDVRRFLGLSVTQSSEPN